MIDFTKIKKLTIGGIELKQLLINGIQVWKSGYKNWVKYSTEADGVTIYNNGLGYKDGYRIRSGGAEGSSTNGSCTGFIPLKIGDTLRIYPPFDGGNTYNAINFSDATFTNIGQITDDGAAYGTCDSNGKLYKSTVINGVSTLTLTDKHDSRIAYVRVTNRISSPQWPGAPIDSGSEMIVTVNEEIE